MHINILSVRWYIDINVISHLDMSPHQLQQQSIDNILSTSYHLDISPPINHILSTTVYRQHSINSINLSTKFYQQHLLSIDNILSTSHHLDISPHQSTSYVIVIQYIYIHDSHSVYIHTWYIMYVLILSTTPIILCIYIHDISCMHQRHITLIYHHINFLYTVDHSVYIHTW